MKRAVGCYVWIGCLVGLAITTACDSHKQATPDAAVTVASPPVAGKDAPVQPPVTGCARGGAVYAVGSFYTENCVTYICQNNSYYATSGMPCPDAALPAMPDAAVIVPDAPVVAIVSDATTGLPDAPALSDLKVTPDAVTTLDSATERDLQIDVGEAGTDMVDAFTVFDAKDTGTTADTLADLPDVSFLRDAASDMAVIPNPDTAPPCPGNQLFCLQTCTDQRYDPANCGACRHQCGANETCSSGACLCANGMMNCSGVCSQPVDNLNCGICGHVCPSGSICAYAPSLSGALISCQCTDLNTTMCPTGCVDLRSSPSNCGACNHTCQNDELCSQGTCVCANGGTRCNGTCNTLRNNANCSACGDLCPGGSSCVTTITSGKLVSSCRCSDQNQIPCSTGCHDPQTDSANCGSCGHQCLSDESCSNGTCVCANGGKHCGNVCSTLEADNANCGSCGNACPTGSTCTTTITPSGKSTICQCADSSQIACPGGCKAPISDPLNCGACNVACAADEICSSGSCKCTNGGMKCPVTGICTLLQSDDQNCGGCGHTCPAGSQCTNSSCSCTITGQTMCTTGCADLQNDAANCGGCGTHCANQYVCRNGMCQCPENTMFCGNHVCTSIVTNTDCGICGNACRAGTTCSEQPGKGRGCYCDNPALTSCNSQCVDLSSDAANCGYCSTQCHDHGTCSGGTCHGSYAICDSTPNTYGCPLFESTQPPAYWLQTQSATGTQVFDSLQLAFVPSANWMNVTFDYKRRASSCWLTSSLYIYIGVNGARFDFPGYVQGDKPCDSEGTVTIPVQIYNHSMSASDVSFSVYGGDWASSVRITGVTFTQTQPGE